MILSLTCFSFIFDVIEMDNKLLFDQNIDLIVGFYQEIMNASGFNASFGNNHQYNHLAASNSSDKKGQSECKKIFCAYHSTQFLTNFCIHKQCLMPLCPTCVVQHTEEHYESNQKPAYVNLNDALTDSRQRCYANIIKLEEFNRKNIEMSNYIQGLPDYIRKQLADCKQKIFHFIEDRFEAFESQLIDEIRAKYNQEGVYNRKQCEQVREFIGGEIQALYEKITQLKGDQCLSALIRYYETDQQKLQSQMSQIVEYIERNRNAGGLYISINGDEMTQTFSKVCERLVNVQYIQQDQSRSLNSTRNFEQQGSNRKPMNSSQTNNRQTQSKNFPLAKQKQQTSKNLTNSQSFSSRKQQQKNSGSYYPSPLKSSPHF